MSHDAGATAPQERVAHLGAAPGGRKRTAGSAGSRAGRAGLAITALSIAATVAVGLAGPSAMEPALPGRPGQPPWALGLHLSPYAAVGLAAAALVAGTAGLGLCLHAIRRGWTTSPRLILAAGLVAAAVITLVPPFGSSDHLSYAAYGRMVITGHDPYLTTPAMLARLGDPVAGAVQDWRHSPSVYGSLASGGQALASWIGGDSIRLTVFVLSLLGLAAFAGTGLLLHALARGSRERQLRAGLLWTLNPLLLQVLVAGAHVDSQAIVFGVAAIAIFALGMPNAPPARHPLRRLGVAAAAGAVAGLAFSVKLSFALVAAGLVVAALLAWWPRPAPGGSAPGRRRPAAGKWGAWRPLLLAVGGVAAGFAVTAAVAFVPWGLGSAAPALRAGKLVSIGSPWRAVRSALHLWLGIGEGNAGNLVRAGAIVVAVLLLVLFTRPLLSLAGLAGPPGRRGPGDLRGQTPAAAGPAAGCDLTTLTAASVFVFGFAWLIAWPYVLPWYDGLAWALLALLPWTSLPWAALDWLVLARTAALAFGYLPARGIALPSGLGWLQSVVRTAVTPVALLAVAVILVLLLCPYRPRWPQRRPARRTGPELSRR
jgi:alpha-1,6-mannosyltransferase